MGKTYRKHVPAPKDPRDRRQKTLKSHKQRRPGERTALRKEYR